MSIKLLFDKYGTDKSGPLNRYETMYDLFLPRIRALPQPRILEIGVFKGASLLAWREYFGSNAEISGIDLHATEGPPGSNARVFKGNQKDLAVLNEAIAKAGPFWDLIIDDGSHFPEDQNITFAYLWPHVAVGGMFVIEDCSRNLRPEWKAQGITPIVDSLYEQARKNLEKNHPQPPDQFICYCGHAVIVMKV